MVVKKLYNLADKAAQHKVTRPILLAMLALSIGLLVAVWPESSQSRGEDPDGVLRFSVDVPSEQAIPDTYSVPDGQPLSIEISSVSIKGFIQKVGIDQHQAVTAPNNVHLAGWFIDSVKPGESGLSIIDGHVSGRSADGIFKKLPEVKNDDEIVITMGGGGVFVYKVFATKTVPNDQAAKVLFEQNPSVTHQLNLITCTGRYDANTRTYADRAIVYARLVQD